MLIPVVMMVAVRVVVVTVKAVASAGWEWLAGMQCWR